MKAHTLYKIIIFGFLCFFCIHIMAQSTYSKRFNLSTLEIGKDYIEDILIIKIKPEFSKSFDNKEVIEQFLKSKGVKNLSPMFPYAKKPSSLKNDFGQKLVDLTLIYTVKIDKDKNIASHIDNIYHLGYFEYVEPYYIPHLLYTPDDPNLVQQYHLNNIKAFNAWNISKGDTNTVIGIVDTGTDLNHPDLTNSLKYNYNDPINGFDSDNDGFIDNYHGWDLGENDNNPQYNQHGHGIHVSGISSATVNNNIGIAGVGFKAKYLPVKIDDEYGKLTKAYQGIVYAADMGCKIINCSWGSQGGSSQFGQDIVNYATYNCQALVVAAAGNINAPIFYFPASYNNVLSVAATTANDIKWSSSTYNMLVDLTAPGHQILSTWVNGTYITSSGTSMAAPIVSGGAALLASHFPNYLPIQLIAQLKATADNIDTIPDNAVFAGKLGSGRLNLHRALTETHHQYTRLISHDKSSETLGTFGAQDTLTLGGKIVNYLAPSTNLTCTLRSASPYIIILDSVIQIGSILNTLDTFELNNNPFKIYLKPTIPFSEPINFELIFNDQNYNDKQYFYIIFNLDYLDLDTNNITVTLTSKSRLGYNDTERMQGKGLLYKSTGTSLLRMGGLIIGNSPSKVVDNVYGSIEDTYNNNFYALSPIKQNLMSPIADFHATTFFSDSMAGAEKLNVHILNNIYAWDHPDDENYFISEYLIINKDVANISNLYAGLFMDWSIPEAKYHRVDFEVNNKIGYAYSSQGEYYTGTKLLTSGNYRFYGFDNISGLKFNDGFTNYEKYTALRTNRFQAGSIDLNNNVATLYSSGPHNIPPGDTITIAFAVMAGNHLNDISNAAIQALNKYDNPGQYIQQTAEAHILIYPNPTRAQLNIRFNNGVNSDMTLKMYNVLGQCIHTETIIASEMPFKHTLSTSHFKKGTYTLYLQNAQGVHIRKVIIQ